MNSGLPRFNLDTAVPYHYNAFPPKKLDLELLLEPITAVTASLSRYDEMLRMMVNSEVLLGPLRRQEAVVSSRMEGTISTLDEVLQLEADEDSEAPDAQRNARNETIEVLLYSRALKTAQEKLSEGAPFSDWLVRGAHQLLLAFGRGADKKPGQYKTEQNYVGAKGRETMVSFIPISPEKLQTGMDSLFHYIRQDRPIPILRTAIAHIEFEALHPFEDGNGRVGRMLIPLMLWQFRLISQPHFFVSGYFEDNKEEYITLMRRVSSHGEWSAWCHFFLTALDAQAQKNMQVAGTIKELYARMREQFRAELASQWTNHALDFIFANPVFRNNRFTTASGIPAPTAHKFTNRLVGAGLLKELQPASGRRAALYSFEPLLEVIRER